MLARSMACAVRNFVLIAFALIAIGASTFAKADGPYLTLVETVADPVRNWAGNWTAQDGAVTNLLYGDGSYASQIDI